MREMVLSTLVLIASIVFSLINLGFYWNKTSAYQQLTFSKPFSDWYKVRDAFYDLEGKNFNATIKIFQEAWCTKPSFRPYQTIQNRSGSCDCLYKRVSRLLNETNLTRPFPRDIVRRYGSDSIGCLAYRGVWDVWPCEGGCKAHPLVLAFTLNFIGVLLCFGFQIGMVYSNAFFGIGLANALIAILGSIVLISLDPAINAVYCVPFLYIVLAFQFAIKDEVSSYPSQENSVRAPFSPPAPFMVCFWLGYAVTTPLLLIYLATSHLVRDVAGLVAYGFVGYFLGLMGQRQFWVKWYVSENFPIDAPVEASAVLRKTFGNLMWYALMYGQIVLWLGVAVLGITQYASDSPFAGAPASIAVLCAQALICVLEFFNGSRQPLQFGLVETAQVSLMLLVHGVVTFAGVADVMR